MLKSPGWSDFPVGSHENQAKTGRRKKLRRGRGRVRRSDGEEREAETDDIEERSDVEHSSESDGLSEKTHNERSAVYPKDKG